MRKSTTLSTATINMNGATMMLHCGHASQGIEFVRVPLVFEGDRVQNVFGEKNNKSVANTIGHHRYASLATDVNAKYSDSLDTPLGIFLMELKSSRDGFYKRFLNNDGDLTYSSFNIRQAEFFNKKGVYAYLVNDQLKYIGRCKDSIKNRVNQGYGSISPKNCYIDGQRTNCRINALITKSQGDVSFWLHPLESTQEIECLEKKLIESCKPEWNIQYG